MSDPFAGWSRMFAAGAELARTGFAAAETWHASAEVIAARGTIIGEAVRQPLAADRRELGRMVPEKLDAFTLAGLAALRAGWAMQDAWLAEIARWNAAAARGQLGPGNIAELSRRSADLALDTVTGAAAGASATIAPVHARATANARRLKRRR